MKSAVPRLSTGRDNDYPPNSPSLAFTENGDDFKVLRQLLGDAIDIEDLAMGIICWHGELETASDTQVVFRDSAFANDIVKTNMTAILEQHGIAHVRSL